MARLANFGVAGQDNLATYRTKIAQQKDRWSTVTLTAADSFDIDTPAGKFEDEDESGVSDTFNVLQKCNYLSKVHYDPSRQWLESVVRVPLSIPKSTLR